MIRSKYMGADKTTNYTLRAIRSCILLAFFEILLILLLPANKHVAHMYHLTNAGYHVLLFATTLPSIMVWPIGFYAYAKLFEYADSIAKSSEGIAFTNLARGIMVVAWSQPAIAIINTLVNAISNAHVGFQAAAAIINNYTSLILPLVGFSYIGLASKQLLSRIKTPSSMARGAGVMFAFVAGGVLFCYLVFRKLDPTNLGSTHNAYYLPVWLVIVSLIIPYLYVWFIGLLAALEIHNYSNLVRGLLYRQPLRLVVIGLIIVVGCLIGIQYLGTVVPTGGRLTLNYALLVRLVFRVMTGAGFILITLGALKLRKIEEV